MKTAILIFTVFVLALFSISAESFAVGSGGKSAALAMMGNGEGMGSMGGGMGSMAGGMGSNGGGMGSMGGHGASGISEWMLKLWKELSNNTNTSKQQEGKEVETLRQQVREKRRELSVLVRAPNPDKELIDEKIDELNRLESELDSTIERY